MEDRAAERARTKAERDERRRQQEEEKAVRRSERMHVCVFLCNERMAILRVKKKNSDVIISQDCDYFLCKIKKKKIRLL